MFCQARPDEGGPSMAYSQPCQSPLYVFETTAGVSKSPPGAIIMQASVSVDIELAQKPTVPAALGVCTCSQPGLGRSPPGEV